MKDSIKAVLGLQGYVVYGLREDGQRVRVRVRIAERRAKCSGCGELSDRVHQRGRGLREVGHVWFRGRQLVLVGRVRRYWCGRCGRPFTERWPGVRVWGRRTEESEREIGLELRAKSFGRIGEERGLNYGVLRRVLERQLGEVDLDELLALAGGELHLGIDGHSFRGQRMVLTVAEVRQRRLLSLLADDRKLTLQRYIRGLSEEVRRAIVEVCMDMNERGRVVVEEELPWAKVVVDYFHVIQDANRRVDEARRLEQEMSHRAIKKNLSF